ncbi:MULTISPECIES: Hsp20/alpha crystallin family protein [unclassified Gordonia (in: high G+C Gram-positive bacteria)]|uniref:Hsp20/alpha crystallin family protein n=1 Tax=unclassified Gordonia (in: high G+C Gram-positive bacteria) TaxID=2657482 RepID=UPI0009910FBA|nr:MULTISPECIES: Hsp20/alpha crystallin family protein [unclassified Gordonia (in: high G+C Gram-positive bacteria)]MCX2753629.1 Hsp20/alpha crystallin family protein [Gordonia sp. 4N]
MSTPTTHHASHSFLPDIAELFSTFPAVGMLRPNGHLIRVEEESSAEQYVVRAELPGVDPDKDVTVTILDGVLTIAAQRTERSSHNGHSEFAYGEFSRAVSLPKGYVEDGVKATYSEGILTVTVPLSAPTSPGTQVQIETA